MTTELMLRTCDQDMTSFWGFTWPREGLVKAPDWDPIRECGNGLHGLLWGEGDGALLSWQSDAVWMVCEVDSDEVVELQGKIKVPECKVVHCGNRQSATDYLLANGGEGKAVVGAGVTAGHKGIATAGHRGTATAGDWGTATVGDWGTAIAGFYGTSTAGYRGTAAVGTKGTSTAGDEGTATAGALGTATTGYQGTATAGYKGIATAGALGTAIAGDRGTATAGDWGVISIWWHDNKAERARLATGYIGEDGLLPNTPYRLDYEGNFVGVKEQTNE